MKDIEVYRNERYILGMNDDCPYVIICGKKYILTCHPYEPCLYITGEDSLITAVHNAFDPYYVLDAFHKGEIITSITGFEYDANDFCRMVEYSVNMADINIDEAESVFEGRAKKKGLKPEQKKENKEKSGKTHFFTEPEQIIADDPFYDVISEYPDCEVEFCLVKNSHLAKGYNAHMSALEQACLNMFFDGKEQIWHYDLRNAKGNRVETEVLFEAASDNRCVNYRGALRFPPCGIMYTDKDFDRINEALFPNGTDGLEVYGWTTDWSDYFEDGHEWWGTLCYTIYDKTLDRFVVIMASATD